MVQVSVSRAKKVAVPKGTPRYRSVPFLCFVFVMAISIEFMTVTRKPFQTEQAREITVQPREPTVYPVANRDIINGTNVLFAEPATINGILFVAHGCSHSHTDWFLGCEGCIGLPEERAIVKEALDLGLVVVALSSSDRESMCWSIERDVESVGLVLQEMAKRYGPSLPILLFGASSGGAFVSLAATPLAERFHIQLAGFISQIASLNVRTDTTKCRVYITMNKDERTDAKAALLTSSAQPQSKSLHIRLPPLPIHDDFFATRIPEIDMEHSAKMAKSLRKNGLLDDGDFLRDSPRRSNWRAAIEPLLPLPGLEGDTLAADLSLISEVMNVADGEHEMTRDGVKEALEFCLQTPPS
jgi:hypothetical protein